MNKQLFTWKGSRHWEEVVCCEVRERLEKYTLFNSTPNRPHAEGVHPTHKLTLLKGRKVLFQCIHLKDCPPCRINSGAEIPAKLGVSRLCAVNSRCPVDSQCKTWIDSGINCHYTWKKSKLLSSQRHPKTPHSSEMTAIESQVPHRDGDTVPSRKEMITL